MIDNNKHGVVAADGAYYVIEAQGVDGFTGCSRASRQSLYDYEVLSAGIRKSSFPEDLYEAL